MNAEGINRSRLNIVWRMTQQSGHCLAPALISVALLLPHLFASNHSTAPLQLGLPRVFSGDEPHYLLAINSLVIDGDLDLSNNYAAVHKGATQAGQRWARYRTLDHHTVWFEHGVRRYWWNVYEGAHWDRDSQDNPVPRLRQGASPPPDGQPEYPTHSPGLALLLTPFLLPFRGSQFIEPVAIYCSGLAVVLSMFMFRSLIKSYNHNIHSLNLVTAVTFLGTPIWHYGRTLFTEPYLLLFTIASYDFALQKKVPLIAGVFIGLGMLMKPPFALLMIPLLGIYVIRRELLSAALLLLPVCLSFAAILYFNQLMFGSPARVPLAWEHGSFLTGAIGMLFSVQYGLLIVAPAIVIVFAVWPSFFKAHPRDGIVIASAVIVWFVFFASYAYWSGAVCYGPRYLVPVLPLLFVGLANLPHTSLWQNRWGRYGTIIICALSIGINAIAAMKYWKYWDSNPLLSATYYTYSHSSRFMRAD